MPLQHLLAQCVELPGGVADAVLERFVVGVGEGEALKTFTDVIV